MIHWVLIQWHWLMILGAIASLVLFGFAIVVIEPDGSWWEL